MLPSNVSTGRVTGRFIIGVQDGPDPDVEPDFIAAVGTIDFTASVPYLPNPTDPAGPVTLLKTTIRGVLDAEGYLCTPLADGSPGVRGVRLVATDDPDLLVTGWTWTVTYRFSAVNGSTPSIASHSIAVPSDATVDLTTAIKVPSSPGVGLPQAEAAVLRAEAAATDSAQASAVAEAAALDVVTRANSGEFKGDQGSPGNATMRVDTTVGTRVFITDGVTERLVTGDTGWRIMPLAWGTGTVYLKRENDTVRMIFVSVRKGADPSATFLNLPAGFRPYAPIFNAVMVDRDNVTSANGLDIEVAGPVKSANSALLSVGRLQFNGSWPTTNAWPTSLPGTPA